MTHRGVAARPWRRRALRAAMMAAAAAMLVWILVVAAAGHATVQTGPESLSAFELSLNPKNHPSEHPRSAVGTAERPHGAFEGVCSGADRRLWGSDAPTAGRAGPEPLGDGRTPNPPPVPV